MCTCSSPTSFTPHTHLSAIHSRTLTSPTAPLNSPQPHTHTHSLALEHGLPFRPADYTTTTAAVHKTLGVIGHRSPHRQWAQQGGRQTRDSIMLERRGERMEFLLPGRTRIGDDGRKRGRRKELLLGLRCYIPHHHHCLLLFGLGRQLNCSAVLELPRGREGKGRKGTRKRFQPEGGTENVSVLVRVFNVVVVVVGSCAWG